MAMASSVRHPWRASLTDETIGLRAAWLPCSLAAARNCSNLSRPGRVSFINGGSAAMSIIAATLAGIARRGGRTAAFAQRRIRSKQRSHPQARTVPKPSVYGEWLYGIPSGLPELDERVRAVPGETTLLDVSISPTAFSKRGADAAVKLVLTWVSALACKEQCKFDMFCDHAQPEQLIWQLQHYGKKRPADQLAWTLEHFKCHHIGATALLADALMAMHHVEGSCTAMRGVVLLVKGVAEEDYQLRQLKAIRLKQLARATGRHVWVVRLCEPRLDLCDELQNISDNYLTVESTAEEAKVCVRKVRNRFAGNADLQPWCLKYCCSQNAET